MSSLEDTFPRSHALPSQSCLYWVDQKDRYLRQLLIRDIEQITGRRLMVYFTSGIGGGMIDQNDDRFLVELIRDIKPDTAVDFLLETPGGVVDSAHKLILQLENAFSDLRILVPHRVKSAGTIVSLAAQTIVMGPDAELGPADPLINGVPAYDILNIESFKETNPLLVQAAYKALEKCALLVTELLCKNHGFKEKEKAEAVVKNLVTNSRYHTHGTPLDHKEAQSLGLKIDCRGYEDELMQRLWLLYCMYDYDATLKNIPKIFETRKISHSIQANG